MWSGSRLMRSTIQFIFFCCDSSCSSEPHETSQTVREQLTTFFFFYYTVHTYEHACIHKCRHIILTRTHDIVSFTLGSTILLFYQAEHGCMDQPLGSFLLVLCFIQPLYVADTGRKRTLFHCKWANSISHISRMLH